MKMVARKKEYVAILGLNGDVTDLTLNSFVLEVRVPGFASAAAAEYFANGRCRDDERHGSTFPEQADEVFIENGMVWVRVDDLRKEKGEVIAIPLSRVEIFDMETGERFEGDNKIAILDEVSRLWGRRILESLYYGVDEVNVPLSPNK